MDCIGLCHTLPLSRSSKRMQSTHFLQGSIWNIIRRRDICLLCNLIKCDINRHSPYHMKFKNRAMCGCRLICHTSGTTKWTSDYRNQCIPETSREQLSWNSRNYWSTICFLITLNINCFCHLCKDNIEEYAKLKATLPMYICIFIKLASINVSIW